MNSISESTARDVLKAAGSPAADPTLFSANRRENGWAFTYQNTKEIPAGVRAWVVTDDQQSGIIELGETVDAALTRMTTS